ncbi:MAG TPA: hypothetical protein VKQ30_15465 [Ktedonobacterales bacterium]|nr:hypothetical protein [Ktedonobacterales bacterium]
MNNSRDSYRKGGPPERRLVLSGMIRRKLNSVAERERQRSRLVNVLILAQALLTLAITVGYVGTKPAIASIAIGCGALLVYGAALITNRVFHRVSTAAYIFVAGGSVAIAVQVLLQALAGNATQAGQAALLFPAIILEAGLLFAPEVTLIAATVTTVFTAFSILLALSVMPAVDRHQAYLLMVYTLGLQALAGLIAWLLAQFIFESALEAQRSEELQFAQARLDALSSQSGDQLRVQDESIRQIQGTITRALGGEYTARLDALDGQLAPLTDSLNLLLQRVEIATQAEQMRARLEAAALPLIDSIAHMADSSTPTPSSLPIMTNTPLDSLAVVLYQMQSTVAQRLGKVQRLATDMLGGVGHSQEGLTDMTEAVQETKRIAGALTSTTVALLEAARHQVAQVGQMRRLLAAVLPAEITQMPAGEQMAHDATGLNAQEAAELLGLGDDLGLGEGSFTDVLNALPSEKMASEGANIVPFTKPLPVVKPGSQGEDSSPGHAAFLEGELPIELVEAWTLLINFQKDLVRMEQQVGQVRRDLVSQTRNMRAADVKIAWMRQALAALHTNAEQLQQAAGANPPPPGQSDFPASPSRPLPPQPPRGTQLTRPLTDRLDDISLPRRADATPTPTPTPTPLQRGDGERQMNVGNTPVPPPLHQDDDVPAPGSMRLADLIAYDGPLSGPLGPTSNPLTLGPNSGPLGTSARMPHPDAPEERK